MIQAHGQPPTLRSAEVAALAGISLRQLQLWEEQGVAVAGRRGRRRAYTPEQALLVVLLSELRQRRLSFQRLRRLAPLVRELLAEWRAWEVRPHHQLFLVASGHRVGVADSTKIGEYVSNLFKPFLCVSVSMCAQRIQDQCVAENRE